MKNNITESEIKVRSFTAPKFVKTKKALTLIELFRKCFIIGEAKSLDFFQWSNVVRFSNKNNVNFKETINTGENTLSNKEYDFNTYRKPTYMSRSKNTDIENPEYKEITVKVKSENNIFRSYIQRLEEITNDMKVLNQKKLEENEKVEKNFIKPKLNNLSEAYIRTRSAFPQLENTSSQNVVPISTINSDNNKYSVPVKNLDILNKTKALNDSVKYGSYNFDDNIYRNNNQFSKKDNILEKEVSNRELPNANIDKMGECYSEIKNVIQDILLSYKSELRNEITNLVEKDNLYQESFKESLNEMKKYIFTLQEDYTKISSSNNKLYANQLDEMLNLLKSITLHLSNLNIKYEKLTKEESGIVKEIKYLENTLESSNKNFFNSLIDSLEGIKNTQLKQDSNYNAQTQNLVEQFKNLNENVDSKYKFFNTLSEKITTLSSKQEELNLNAQAIKNFILNQDKEKNEIKNNEGVAKLIEEIKVNSSSAIKEQSVLNENLYKDMEVIKKSILKLVNEQQKEKIHNSSNNITKPLVKTVEINNNAATKTFDNVIKSENNKAKLGVNKSISSSYKNVPVKEETLESNNKKSAQIMAIGKLKEALDLEAIHSMAELHKEYIDEIIEDRIIEERIIEEKPKTNNAQLVNLVSNNVNDKNVNKKSNVQKINEQSTFVLDTSKFFK